MFIDFFASLAAFVARWHHGLRAYKHVMREQGSHQEVDNGAIQWCMRMYVRPALLLYIINNLVVCRQRHDGNNSTNGNSTNGTSTVVVGIGIGIGIGISEEDHMRLGGQPTAHFGTVSTTTTCRTTSAHDRQVTTGLGTASQGLLYSPSSASGRFTLACRSGLAIEQHSPDVGADLIHEISFINAQRCMKTTLVARTMPSTKLDVRADHERNITLNARYIA